ncbi:MAG: hypothetical protein K5786_03930 [Treponema sp.]|nr:hypothetical protein [Treponema sp.]
MIKTKLNKIIKNCVKTAVCLAFGSLFVACASTTDGSAENDSVESETVESTSEDSSSDATYASAVTLIEKTTYTSSDTIPSYYSFYNDGGFIDDKGWMGNSSATGNVPVDETAITIDLSKVSGASIKAGDKLSISMSITNCNGSNAAAVGLYLDSTEVGATESFIGNSGSKQESFSQTIVVPAADSDGYQIYLKVLEKECRVKIKNLEVTNAALQ